VPEKPAAGLELQRIRDLADELESTGYALKFLSDYFCMLPGRLERILGGLRESDAEAASDAILSLKITSSMSGALDTESCCRALEQMVRAGRFDLAIETSQCLKAYVSALVDATPSLLREARMDLHQRHRTADGASPRR
jgi:hypothetical protein